MTQKYDRFNLEAEIILHDIMEEKGLQFPP